ncbi:SusC/RagA family TonB-linked outer membrane protein [Dyadobacter chenwenxiniae]|uniref:SusC/RagA family TonB-linked outer membrane protein n=1 Tax=Dyadobacter chenwenxiniae TaxID=2906456 RepID=A0A9X1PLI0_9BACT|nr:SusC/RagA family TonB-linked outer membrane protein [Dyadobacter chenwenxiniae]MCF0063300.1 SusC/RagA family TonB-linked outer membrane protein [Dyadobacter chenwenxiniae]UON85321.1 SusC/RagA family TonB-linked outer membrane protein [Dyadobacter chenwenxiniae]
MKTRFLYLFLLTFLVTGFVSAQQRVITGIITDANDGSPLPGASVAVKGTSSGTLSDADGSFTLNVNDETSILVVSFIGYLAQDVAIGNSNKIAVALKADTRILNEVVVTALGISREKRALGYAVQEIKGEALQTRPTNALSALSGKVAGLQVTTSGGNMGGSSRVLLRGINSISGNNQPLYVIDGTPIDNADLNSAATSAGSGGKDVGNMIQDINPDDIENISVLKGPSAAALYGTRAANGVILITTKKGKENSKVNITLNTGIEFEQIVRLPKRQKLYGGGFSSTFQQAKIGGTDYNIAEYAVDESWGPKLDGTPVLHWYNLDPENTAEYLKPQPWSYPKNDVHSFFETGVANTNSLSVSGGNANSTYRLSYTNKNVKGTVPNSSLKRNSINFSGSTQLGKLKVYNNFNYIKNQSTGRPWTGATNRNIILEAFQWGQVQVDYDKLKNYKRADGTQILWNRSGYQNTPAGEAAKFIDNPYWSANESYLDENRDRFYGNVGLVYDVNSWLKVSGKVNADVYNYQYQDRIAVYSRTQSQYQEYINNFSEFNYELLASANKSWDDFSLNVNVGGNIMSQKRRISDAVTQGGLIIPEYYNLKNASSVLVNSNAYRKQINSLFASFSLGYRSLLFLDGTLRNDWSSTLPIGKNSFAYPSLTTSLILSELNGVKDIGWLDFAKVRLGWAQVGNDTDPYQLQRAYEATQSFDGLASYKLPNQLNNQALKPEITSSWETGLSIQAFKNRVGLDVTYYDNVSRNQIINIPVSSAFGYDSKVINAGKINNKGVEVTLTGTPIRQNGFEWNSSLNWSRNRNKVIQLAPGVNTFQLANSLVTLVAREGQPYGQILGNDFIYAADGQKVIKADGTYERGQQLTPLGSVLPKYLFGFQNSFTYKNFNLGFLVDGRVGGKFFSQTYKVGMYSGVLEKTAANNVRETGVVLEGVKGTVTYNADGTYEVTNTSVNDTRITAQAWARGEYSGPTPQTIFDATFVKLREITFGYNLPLANKTVKSVYFGLYGRNLVNIYTASKYIDPEFTSSGGNIQGLEGGSIPVPATYGLNVNVKF